MKFCKQRKLLITILAILFGLSLFLFVGCGGCDSREEIPVQPVNPDGGKVSAFLFKRTNITMLIYEDMVLQLEDGIIPSDLTWKSSDDTVATVSGDGVVTAKKAGKTTITVNKTDELSDTCVVNVIDNNIRPTLILNTYGKEINLYENSSFDLDVRLKYNGTEYNDFTCNYVLSNDNVATLVSDGMITAMREGSSLIDVKVFWRGVEISETITLNVIDPTYITLDKNSITLYAANPVGYDFITSAEFTPVLKNMHDEVIDGIAFTLVENVAEGATAGNVAESDGYRLKATGLGETDFVFKCIYSGKEYTSEIINVKVIPCVIPISERIYTEKGEGFIDINEYKPCTIVENASIDGENVEVNGDTCISVSSLTNGGHTVKFALNGDRKIEYTMQLVVADKLITSANELKSMNDPNAYYVLTKDIDASGLLFNKLFVANWQTKPEGNDAGAFQGVFDGQGHTIFNLNVEGFGLFGTIGNKGIVKDIGFYNVFGRGSGSIDFGLTTDLYGRLENVSFHQDGSDILRAVIGRANKGSSINNLVIYTANSTLGLIDSTGGANWTDYKNIFVISSGFSGHSKSAVGDGNWFSSETYKTDPVFNAIDFSEKYDCTESGLWAIDYELKLPLIKRSIIIEGLDVEYAGESITIGNDRIDDVKTVSINGNVLADSDYSTREGSITINNTTLKDLTAWQNLLVIETSTLIYKTQIIIYTYISDAAGIQAIVNGKGNPYAYYKLTQDIDCNNALYNSMFASNWYSVPSSDADTIFQGVFDGQGHTISNFRVGAYGLFGSIGKEGIIKNVGFYNVGATSTNKTIDFGIAAFVYGKIENVSFVQNDVQDIGAIIGRVFNGSKINKFVAYLGNVNTANVGGLFNTVSGTSFTEYSDIYLVANTYKDNCAKCNYFNTATYKTDETFRAIDFTEIFYCTANGIWTIDETLGIPLIKR